LCLCGSLVVGRRSSVYGIIPHIPLCARKDSDLAETPLRRQYLQIKSQYPDAIVFFRLGDFYETFDDDAAIVARVCDVVLTSRPTSKDQRIPMAGVPYHSAEGYITRLVQEGYKVEVAEQLSEPTVDEASEAR